MGYILKDIAEITEPARVSLSGLPNFIKIASKTSGGTRYEVRIAPTSHTAVLVTIQDGGGGIRALQGTTDPEAVEGSVFFISTDPLETAENLKAALLNDSYIFANYDVYSDISWNAGAPTVNGVVVKAKDIGVEFNLTVTGAGATVTAISAGTSTDSLRGAEPIVEVSVDLYREEAGQYIHTAAPAGSLGTPIITLSKSYNGAPVWFDLNGIAAQNLSFSWLNDETAGIRKNYINPESFIEGNYSFVNGNHVNGINWLSINMQPVPDYLKGQKMTLSGGGIVTSGVAAVVVRDSGGAVILKIAGDSAATFPMTFTVPLNAATWGFTVANELNIGQDPTAAHFVNSFQLEVGASATSFTPFDVWQWFNTGTATAYRALVRKGNFSQVPFYISEILYAITGYGYLENPRELLPYAYVNSPVKTLTERPTAPYVKGQKEYINFLIGTSLTGKQISLLQRSVKSSIRIRRPSMSKITFDANSCLSHSATSSPTGAPCTV